MLEVYFGVKLNRFNSSFPVGKIKIEYMYPMNFEEFLLAVEKKTLLKEIKSCYATMSPIPSFMHKEALELYRKYLCIGGMPESVKNFIENDMDILKHDTTILSNIVEMYIADMKKYVKGNVESIKIEKVYKNISTQLAKENKVFKYNLIEENGRKRMFETPIEWLISSGMVSPSYLIKKPEIPLKVYINEDIFKLYLSDVGILTSISDVKYSDIVLETPFEFKGAITENYVAQQFISKDIPLYFWKQGRNAEIDFVIYNNEGIIPIEVKSSKNTKSTSLNKYIQENKPKYAIRISSKNFGFENNIKSVPLYAVFLI